MLPFASSRGIAQQPNYLEYKSPDWYFLGKFEYNPKENYEVTPHKAAGTIPADVLALSGKKLRIYAREGVTHAWLVDPLRRSLEVLALESGGLEQVEEHHGDSAVRARPFDAVELELRVLWS